MSASKLCLEKYFFQRRLNKIIATTVRAIGTIRCLDYTAPRPTARVLYPDVLRLKIGSKTAEKVGLHGKTCVWVMVL